MVWSPPLPPDAHLPVIQSYVASVPLFCLTPPHPPASKGFLLSLRRRQAHSPLNAQSGWTQTLPKAWRRSALWTCMGRAASAPESRSLKEHLPRAHPGLLAFMTRSS